MEEYNTDYDYMKLALKLAAKGRGRTSPNPMVGAVIVKDGEIVGKGYHHAAGKAHAEINALQDAGKKAAGATVYVTLEPCFHYGKTSPCTEALIKAEVDKVIVAMKDPNPKVSGRGLKELAGAGIEVESGLLKEEAKKLNEAFIKYITTGHPFVILKNAMTLDGKIATKTGDSKWISCKESRQYVHQLRDEVDGILVGIGTVLADNPRLTTRLPNCKGEDPIRIVLDNKLKIPLDSNLVTQKSEAETVVVTDRTADKGKVAKLEKAGVRVLVLPVEKDKIDLKALLTKLGEMGIMSLLVEGGSQINTSFLFEELVNKVIYFIAPKIVGGNKAVPVVGGQGVSKVVDGIEFEDYELTTIGDDILIVGYPAYKG
ncbi:bifunctional diaminohydroxyphosphoribosylaminopyrimidine deaminase/5-amino-6-(5-phosphoribosylamino)uracil reductase RibD [Sporohalobacter salinus]|uniref:bifunctional diaminohydroxyphosphoribosylaminopyrimidine deaminase/5-amino-6-(5-phosphoribosylamino)uracil reductase RibD n=1 Tax=Sporohalobacter salinus TaxID=1494606 RepID=UPI0019612534|nr:bifunctional diaminohydroxyphosphoribosylaminopyrimidine deaminase/5-amino-6-(5-phosphoribosylamino)uracil reductase RibD [Sporohalobacter salinus]MBM7623316.1 diaminohydroxyphosphoribosylaminopyrimidine deaminase/5-amino-6-(5-phosphoribosylamino)uracil reductase [Sporohalobacter salinus]